MRFEQPVNLLYSNNSTFIKLNSAFEDNLDFFDENDSKININPLKSSNNGSAERITLDLRTEKRSKTPTEFQQISTGLGSKKRKALIGIFISFFIFIIFYIFLICFVIFT